MTIFGTPLSPHATKVMLLGSGELGKEVLIALQRLGVETIAVDRYDNAPGQQVAHHARTITMSDPAQLKALIEKEKPHLVVPEIEAIATAMLEELEAAGTARVIPTARAARLTMDREGIRRLAAETLGLPTSPYVFCAASGHREQDWLPLHRQTGHEFIRQRPKQNRRACRREDRMGLRHGRWARQPRASDC
jgi:phosphoribosylglycinamide formyltransferase 2